MNFKNKKYTIIYLSSFVLIILVITNFIIYIDYINSNNKEKGLFEIKLMTTYSYRLYIGIIPLIGLISSIIKINKKETRTIYLFSALVSLIAVTFSILNIWSYFI